MISTLPVLGEFRAPAAIVQSTLSLASAPSSSPAVMARVSSDSAALNAALAQILRPQAYSRWLLPSIAALTPQYVQQVLIAALMGDHEREWELFDLMLDTWPELAACYQELVDGVCRKKLIFEPFHEEDEQPDADAIDRLKLVSAVLRKMQPDVAAGELDLDGIRQKLLGGWVQGQVVLEVLWQNAIDDSGAPVIGPKSCAWVHPTNYGWNMGRLGLRVNAGSTGLISSPTGYTPTPAFRAQIAEFPEHKFLLGLHTPKAGPVLGGAMLRPLAAWWVASNFCADWLLNLCELFGIPFRHATYDPQAPDELINKICAMLQNMGSRGYGAFPAGTEIEFLDAAKGSDHSPQGELLDRADRYARLLILGQTASGARGGGGGSTKAFGAVEKDVKADRIDAAGQYVTRIFNGQFIPAVLALNFGDTENAPCARLVDDEEGSLEKAQTLQALVTAGVSVGENYPHKLFNIPLPAKGEKILTPPQAAAAEKPPEENEDDAVAAGEAPGHPFRGNQYSGGIDATLPDEHWQGSRKELRKRAQEVMKGFDSVDHPQLGAITFSSEGRGETLSRQQSPHDFQSVQALPELVRKARITGFEPDNRGRQDVKGYHSMEAGLRIGQTSYRTQIIVKEANDGTRDIHKFYLHRLRHQHGPLNAKATGPILDPALQPSPGPGGGESIAPGADSVNACLARIAAIENDDDFKAALLGLSQLV